MPLPRLDQGLPNLARPSQDCELRRLLYLTSRGPRLTRRHQLGYALYFALQLLALALLLIHGNVLCLETVESALSLVASLGLLALSPLAHRRALSPSTLITAYLLAKLLCYALWLPQYESSLWWNSNMLASAQLLSTLVLLLLELQSKRGILLQAYAHQPPEAVTSFLGSWVFLWVNSVILKGYKRILSEDEIPILDDDMSSKALRQAIRKAWDARGAFEMKQCFQPRGDRTTDFRL